MNDDMMKNALDQARKLQQQALEAIAAGQEQAKPYLEQAMREAKTLREQLIARSRDSADASHEQTNDALNHLDAALNSGAQALKAHADAAKPFVENFLGQIRDAADQVARSFEKK